MNNRQQQAYKEMLEGKNIFLTGGGGVGKSYLIKQFYRESITKGKKIFITSTTGTSALLIDGSTLHSVLGIKLGKGSVIDLCTTIKKNNFAHGVWKIMEILIIDEVSMLSPILFDKLEEIARILKHNDKPFGGIQIILSGDFCQLPCVNEDSFCFNADSWGKVIEKTHYLTDIIRQSDNLFCNVLNSIRIGDITEEVKEILDKRLEAKIDKNQDIKPTLLYPYNKDVDRINNHYLSKLIDKYKEKSEFNVELDVSTSYRGKVIVDVPETLVLTKECQVMLTFNLDLPNGLVNGSRGVIVSFNSDGLPLVKFLNGIVRVIDFHTYEKEEKGKILYRYYQIPLKLAWCITIHKAQGLTIDLIQTDLSNIFEYGQAYVCLSRVKSLEGLYLQGINYMAIKCHPKALEYYKSIE